MQDEKPPVSQAGDSGAGQDSTGAKVNELTDVPSDQPVAEGAVFHIDLGHVDLGHVDLGHVDLGHIDIPPPHIDIPPPHIDLGHVDLGHVDLGHFDLGHVDLGHVPVGRRGTDGAAAVPATVVDGYCVFPRLDPSYGELGSRA